MLKIASLFNDQKKSDLTIISKCEKVFYAHKFIWTLHATKSEWSSSNTINLDFREEIVLELIRYCYTGPLNCSKEMFTDLVQLSTHVGCTDLWTSLHDQHFREDN